MTRDELLRQILEAKIEWEATSSLLNRDEQDELLVAGDWRVKDIYAHLAWGERQMLDFLRAGKFIGSDWWNLPLHERNRMIYEESRDMPAEKVREDARNVHEALVKTLETLTDEQLNDPAQWPGMPKDWQPWKVIADNSYLHYQEHSADLKRFLATLTR
ncbi:MAG: ClbS/DfsB family four-helix bundle protein [Nitrososphaerales archaeon]